MMSNVLGSLLTPPLPLIADFFWSFQTPTPLKSDIIYARSLPLMFKMINYLRQIPYFLIQFPPLNSFRGKYMRKYGTLNQNDFIIFLPFLSAKENLSPYQRANSVRVSRNRGCNESFRAAVDRSYENDFPEVNLFCFVF